MTATDPLTPAELYRIAAGADPSALLVPPHLVRRAIKHDRGLGGPGLRVPHRHLYLITRERLLAAASPGELGAAELPDHVLLIPAPDSATLKRDGRQKTLTSLWRLLYHGAIHRAFTRLRAASAPDIPARVSALGDAFAEARDVLKQDHLLLADDDASVYEELVCVYLELKAFDPARLAYTFPSCDPAAAEAVFSRDIDAAKLLEACRPAGAERFTAEPEEPPPDALNDRQSSPGEAGPLQLQAAAAVAVGNTVRAALLLQRAAGVAPSVLRAGLLDDAGARIDTLVGRLIKGMRLPEADAPRWRDALCSLLEPASRGYWNRESRLLYDIQRAVHSLEQPLYAADLIEPVVTLFQRPVKRPLPDVPTVLAIKYLRKALGRLPSARVPDTTRDSLSRLLHAAEHRLAHSMRDALRPRIHAALDSAGLLPAGPAEKQSRDRLVEELLDAVEQRGHISLPDLRDAVARSRVNLPDLAATDLIFGDPLLRANEALARGLDGIYRRGEAYLRLMQVFSSVFFGTSVGRILTLYALLPLLAALFTVVGVDALAGEFKHVVHFFAPAQHHHDAAPADGQEKPKEFKMNLFDIKSTSGQTTLYVALGAAVLFYLLLIHAPPFRAAVWAGILAVWRLLRGLLWDGPAAVLRLPFFEALLASEVAQIAWRFVGRPLLWAAPLPLLLWLLGVNIVIALGVMAALFVFLAAALNTRLGTLVEESVADSLSRAWLLLRDDFLVGVWTFIVWFFGWLTERIFALMYTVDEMLRFREGESSLSFAVKCVVGVVWFAVSYVIRFVWLLFLEPQINPIKHFPVVTVGHKLSILAIAPVSSATGMSVGMTTFILGIVPGIYGFIAWELKENWRLYKANQSDTLDPETVGSHGEWVINFVRPGFHSGTLPVLFARLRNASGAGLRRAEEALHHADEDLRRFAKRALLEPLAASAAWAGGPAPSVGEIRLTTRHVRYELRCDGLGSPAWVELANRDGELAAALVEPGWLAGVEGPRREALLAILAAFLRRAGVAGGEPLPWARYAEWWRADQSGVARPSVAPSPDILTPARA